MISPVRPTTWIEPHRLAQRLGLDLIIATETFQHTGSFKFRAAYQVASQRPERRIIAASSGNFGQALARACQLLGKSCIIVMPGNSAQVKIAAVREFGAEVDLVDTARKGRAVRVRELADLHPEAYVASAYDDPHVIEGNASLGEELAARAGIDAVIAPVGGGGLTSGIIMGLRRKGSPVPVFGAEPLAGNDAARSLREGRIVANEREPSTLADGARTLSLGQRNWEILRDGLAGIVEIPEERIAEAACLLFQLANLKVEPTGALGVAALLARPDLFQNQKVCCVASGGNVDPEVFVKLLSPRGDDSGK